MERELRDDELMHYGKRGMKWGVRHNPEKAYAKAEHKLAKLQNKANKAEDKKRKRADVLIRTSASDAMYANAARKADKAKRKVDKWVKAMDSVEKSNNKRNEKYKNKLADKYTKEGEGLIKQSKSSLYSQEDRSALLKAGTAQKHTADQLRKSKVDRSTTKNRLRKDADKTAEAKYNSYHVAYHPDGSVEIVKPPKKKKK